MADKYLKGFDPHNNEFVNELLCHARPSDKLVELCDKLDKTERPLDEKRRRWLMVVTAYPLAAASAFQRGPDAVQTRKSLKAELDALKKYLANIRPDHRPRYYHQLLNDHRALEDELADFENHVWHHQDRPGLHQMIWRLAAIYEGDGYEVSPHQNIHQPPNPFNRFAFEFYDKIIKQPDGPYPELDKAQFGQASVYAFDKDKSADRQADKIAQAIRADLSKGTTSRK